MGEIHQALKRAKEAKRAEPREAGPERSTGAAPSPAEVAAAALGEVGSPYSSEAPEGPGAEAPGGERLQISRERDGDWAPRAVLVKGSQGAAEAFRHFAIQVRRQLERRQANSVMLVSALRGEGKTTTACNLALALASMSAGARIALVDLDLRRPSVARAFGARPRVGVEDILAGEAKLGEVCTTTDLPTLDVYPVSRQQADAHIPLSGRGLPGLLDELSSRYQTVVVDSAPMLLVPDAELILPYVGGIIPVLRARQTRLRVFQDLLGRLPEGSQLGYFLNDAKLWSHASSYDYYQEDNALPSRPEASS